MRQSSPTSAGATYLNRERRIRDLREAARRAQARLPSIRRMILFGSLAAGVPTPRSDADLLVVMTNREGPGRDRVPELLAALSPLPCRVDLFVVSEHELARARQDNAPLVREALTKGIDLL